MSLQTLRNGRKNSSCTTNLCAAVSDCDESEGAWLQLRIRLSCSRSSSLAAVWAERRESGGSYESPCGPAGGPACPGRRARLPLGGASWGRSCHLGQRTRRKQLEEPWNIRSIQVLKQLHQIAVGPPHLAALTWVQQEAQWWQHS